MQSGKKSDAKQDDMDSSMMIKDYKYDKIHESPTSSHDLQYNQKVNLKDINNISNLS